jgi:hypothetical protein
LSAVATLKTFSLGLPISHLCYHCNSIVPPIIIVLLGFLITRSAYLDDFLMERCHGHQRSRIVVGYYDNDARMLHGGFTNIQGKVVVVAIWHTHAFMVMAREGDAINFEGWVLGEYSTRSHPWTRKICTHCYKKDH